ncbi:hypothetical protein [Syntrophomonas wolfei]|uniref:DUF2281 domain-containing protein n=1 Tax=Syntrophomonas wolfei TaxID=863 RepID=A0A354YUR8_9FIRM|nr:hypothetical protein [Syntrophomonas wolfei]HBK53108.1 DUF2281 domain-containing protein [Syntrophomonas wolfei]
MNTAKKDLLELVNRISEIEAKEVLDFALFLEMKRRKTEFKDLEMASQTSCDFWDNAIDDEVWNNA